jgi:integrase
MGAVVERFLKRQSERLRPRTLVEVERHLNVHLKALHRHQISAVDRGVIAAQLTKLAAEKGATVADHARTSLSTLFSWAMREGLVESNPVVATNRLLEPVSRDRVLSDAELRDIWNACRDDDYGRIVKLLLLTGQRREEISALRWSEVNPDTALISLPKERTKNNRAHEVPLSDPALAALPSPRLGRDFLFGDGEGSFTGFSKAKAKLDARINSARADRGEKPMADWRLHDLRRTVATRLSDLGVQPHVVQAALNHVSGHKAGVAGIYNRSAYSPEKRAALNRWGEHITALVEGIDRKVVPLRRGGAI